MTRPRADNRRRAAELIRATLAWVASLPPERPTDGAEVVVPLALTHWADHAATALAFELIERGGTASIRVEIDRARNMWLVVGAALTKPNPETGPTSPKVIS